MEILCQMQIQYTEAGYQVAQVPFRASSVAENLRADALYITKLGLPGHKKGEKIQVELLRGEEYLR